MWQAVRTILARQQANLGTPGSFYPLWYVAAADLAAGALAATAVIQRHALFPPAWPLLAGLAVLFPLIWVVFFPSNHRPVAGVVVLVAVELLVVLRPVTGDGVFGAPDAAPACLWVIVLAVTAVSTPWASLPIAVVAAVALTVDGAMGRLDAAQDVELQITERRYGSVVALSVRNEAPARPPRSGGSGIRGMQQRAQALGGTLQAGHDDGQWIVRAEVPLS